MMRVSYLCRINHTRSYNELCSEYCRVTNESRPKLHFMDHSFADTCSSDTMKPLMQYLFLLISGYFFISFAVVCLL